EIFIKAFERVHTLKAPERFRPWLYRIAVNRVHDFHRKRRMLRFLRGEREKGDQNADIADEKNPAAMDQVIKQDFWRQIKTLSKRLSRWEREVFFLRFMDHLNIEDIARTIGKSESTVKTHLYRALKKFRQAPELLRLVEE
ncbi:MAG: RNA polymerase sigma factor, partial [Deltaproteobacteria bacterium]|nr:RNA polymerase sigma factor [Deltaproteobacteria bacterium]